MDPFSSLPVVLIYNTRLLARSISPAGRTCFVRSFGQDRLCRPRRIRLQLHRTCDHAHALGGDRGRGPPLAGALDGPPAGGLRRRPHRRVRRRLLGWNHFGGDCPQRVDAGDSIALVYPKEGTSLVPDGSALVRNAPTQTMPGPFGLYRLL